MSAVGVLGPGAIGGSLAVRLRAFGRDSVICVGRRPVTELTLESNGLMMRAQIDYAARLTRAVDCLLITVKAPGLHDALDRIDPDAVENAVVLPLMNGLEHVDAIRARFGPCVAAGSISRFEAYRESRARIVQTTDSGVVTMAPGDVDRGRLERAASLLESAGLDVRIWESEKEVLWDKAARLAALSPATALTQRPVADLRDHPEWASTLGAAITEACNVAAADGVWLDEAAQWAIIDSMAPELTTSAARDVAADRPSELDAITGAVVRAGRRLGVPTPTLEELLDRCPA
jgi:2-dehydropantoate 2-reductase